MFDSGCGSQDNLLRAPPELRHEKSVPDLLRRLMQADQDDILIMLLIFLLLRDEEESSLWPIAAAVLYLLLD